jgi:hypothetical protein
LINTNSSIIPWSKLKSLGYSIKHFPIYEDQKNVQMMNPHSWTKQIQLKLWDTRTLLAFEKVSHEKITTLQETRIEVQQSLTYEDVVRELYNSEPLTAKKFINKLESTTTHCYLLDKLGREKINKLVLSWRRERV